MGCQRSINIPNQYHGGMSDRESRSLPEAEFAQQLRAMRSDRGWSQADLAQHMTTHYGMRWHQTTIAKIEVGQRPIGLNEAAALMEVFDLTGAHLIMPSARRRVDVAELQDRKERLRADAAAIEGELSGLRHRRAAVDRRAQQISTQREQAARQAEDLATSLRDITDQLKRTQGRYQNLSKALDEALEDRAAVDAVLVELGERRAHCNAELERVLTKLRSGEFESSSSANPAPEGKGRPRAAHEMLGRQLRMLREKRSISIAAVAANLGSSPSKISRIEHGQIAIKDVDLDALLTFYGLSGDHDRTALLDLNAALNENRWWASQRHLLAEWFTSYLVLESVAQSIQTYEIRLIPGLLQTPAYAEAVIRTRYTDAERIRQLVDVRMQRQRAILEKGSTKVWVILDGESLENDLDDPALMRQQIEFLLEIIERPSVTVQIVKRGAYAVRTNSFSILGLSSRMLPDVVYLENLDTAYFLDSPNQAEPYRRAFNEIATAADQPKSTREILRDVLYRLN